MPRPALGPTATVLPALLVLAALLLPTPAPAAEARQVPESREQIRLSFAPLVREAAPAVVNIYTRRVVRDQVGSPLFDDPFFRRFFGPGTPFGPERRREQNALGSGVIVRPGGLVVTNHHVIANADEIRVVLADRTEYLADTVLSDERTDLAVLQLREVGGRALPALALADTEGLAVGDLVLAIGNPFGVGQTVTSGIVSALARTTVGIADYNFFIQTDAAINPGNSGGALIDLDGRLVGINTAIFSRTGGSLGIGFAIPADMVRAVLASVEAGRPLARPWMGAEGQAVTAELAATLELARPAGVLINRVETDGPAARAGLRVGDVVVAFDGRPVADPETLRYRLATRPLGGEAVLGVRRDGARLDLAMALEPPPEVPPRRTTLLRGRHPFAGATVANLSPALIEEIGYRGGLREGVVVLQVARGSPAARLGLEPQDVLARLNGRPVESVDRLGGILGAGSPGGWRVVIARGDRVIETVVYG